MKKLLVVAFIAAVMFGTLAGVGEAALIFADSVTGSGVENPDAMLGKPNGDFATLNAGGSIFLTFGGSFRDRESGSDFALYFSNPQTTEPFVYVSARNIDGTWVNLDFLAGAGNVRAYEIPGTVDAYYDMIGISTDTYLNGGAGAGVTNGGYAQVPEPGTMVLLGFGLVGLATYGRLKFRK